MKIKALGQNSNSWK